MVTFIKKYLAFLAMLHIAVCLATPFPIRSGFHLPDSITELTLKYKTINNLILLPVRINDTLVVNLILDTGTRNIVLFGKRFQKYFSFELNQQVQFSGLGTGNPVFGKLTLNNSVSIGSVIGLDIPIVVVNSKNLFSTLVNVHGVIGYELFLKFEVEINPKTQQITFRPPEGNILPEQFTRLPLRVVDTRPFLDCEIALNDGSKISELMIDTGSAFGLLLKTNNWEKLEMEDNQSEILGRGLNGVVEGFHSKTDYLRLNTLEIKSFSTITVRSPWHNNASIGMKLLMDYAIVLNYCKGYAGLMRV